MAGVSGKKEYPVAGSVSVETLKQKGRGLVKLVCDYTCDASGVVTAKVIGSAFGRLVAIEYDPAFGAGSTTDTSADLLLTDADSGATVFGGSIALGTSAIRFRPTGVIRDNAGVAVSASGNAVDVNRDIFVAGKLKLGITGGGTSTTGRIAFVVQEGVL